MARPAHLVLLLVFVAAAGVHGLADGIGHDEGVTVHIALGKVPPGVVDEGPIPIATLQAAIDGRSAPSLREIVEATTTTANPTPPAYFLVLRGWSAVFGSHRVALRLLSVAFGVVALLGLARLARRLTGHATAGSWALLLAGLSPWFLSLCTFARPYAMALAIGVWSTAIVLDLVDGRARRGARALFVALSLLGLYTLYHYGFVILWQGCLLVGCAARSPRRGRELALTALTGALIVAGFLPWLPVLRDHLELTGSMRSYFLGEVHAGAPAALARLVGEFGLGLQLRGPWRWPVRAAALLLALGTLLLAWHARRRPAPEGASPRGTLLLASALLYPASILVADLLHGTRTLMITKTSFLLFPLGVLAALAAWSRAPSAHARAVWHGAGACVVLAALAVGLTSRGAFVMDDHRGVARALAAGDTEGHLVMMNSGHRSHAIPLVLTLEEHGVERVSVLHARAEDLASAVTAALGDPAVTRITLLNLDVSYSPGAARLWSEVDLEDAARRARKAGWHVHRPSPQALLARDEPVDGDRRFEIVDGIR